MNDAQKWITALGLIALGISSYLAPFRYSGHNEIARFVGREVAFDGVYSAPFWRGKELADDRMLKAHPSRPAFVPVLDSVALDTGRLAIYWLGIAIATGAGVILIANRKVSV